jgi:WD40 repeat protein
MPRKGLYYDQRKNMKRTVLTASLFLAATARAMEPAPEVSAKKLITIKQMNSDFSAELPIKQINQAKALNDQLDFRSNATELYLPDSFDTAFFADFKYFLEVFANVKDKTRSEEDFTNLLQELCQNDISKLIKLAQAADCVHLPIVEKIAEVFAAYCRKPGKIKEFFEKGTFGVNSLLNPVMQAVLVNALLKDHPALFFWLCRDQANTGIVGRELKGHTDKVSQAFYNKQGTLIVTASRDKTARIYDGNSLECLHVLQADAPISSAVFNEQGTQVVVISEDDIVRIWDAITGKALRSLTDSEGFVCARFNHTGDRIITVSKKNGKVQVIQLSDMKIIFTLKDEAYCAFFNDQDTLIITDRKTENKLDLWDAKTGTLVTTLNSSGVSAYRHVFSGDFIAPSKLGSTYGGLIDPVKVQDIDGKCLFEVKLGNRNVSHDNLLVSKINFYPHCHVETTFNRQGTRIAIGSDSHSLAYVYSIGSEPRGSMLGGHSYGIKALTFNHDGDLLITLSYDKTPFVWNVCTGKQLLRLKSPHWFSVGSSALMTISSSNHAVVATFNDTAPLVWQLFDPVLKKHLLNRITLDQALLLIHSYELAENDGSVASLDLSAKPSMLEQYRDFDPRVQRVLSQTISIELPWFSFSSKAKSWSSSISKSDA